MADWFGFLLEGLWTTLLLVVLSTVLTFALAVPLAVWRISPRRSVRALSGTFVEIFRSIPLPVLLAALYFGFGPKLKGLGLDAFELVVIAIVLNESAYIAEVFKGLLRSVPIGQWQAAASLGMRRWQALRLVILPRLRRPALPHAVNGFIYIVKGSALASIITVPELTLHANQLMIETFRPLEVYALVGVIYLAINIPVSYLGRLAEGGRARRGSRRAAAEPVAPVVGG
ncbi:cysteine ABC transporter permease [Sphaerisporangium krabiense]|uniref:His/Glu/Gln/Arg/opine family amino acid ABC transporter permease subunit n=1 Tax=Sphaerisporangium krabiense TaxID=763782 RepID=A0A7W8Z2E3_9ACTN|nr:amino acid ABC transporter permease [Sphaerisporangium krabiense]MBB5626135.1 His/Glu/Gln/Arg/opine family amino acid ABC transporter permease subunit [Sphaerisporangium krabiense]GII67460.1 cysteine ABC transporter permease [Sphaerisporangium krabiense]